MTLSKVRSNSGSMRRHLKKLCPYGAIVHILSDIMEIVHWFIHIIYHLGLEARKFQLSRTLTSLLGYRDQLEY